VIGNQYFDQLVASAPINYDVAKIEWNGIGDLLGSRLISPSDIVAVSWCTFGLGDIEALTDEPALLMIHLHGLISSAGHRKVLTGEIAGHDVDFGQCRHITSTEVADEHGFGKYCIEFLGTGGRFLGRLQWNWRTRPLMRSRARVAATEDERDRILKVVSALALGTPR
jgi:hypothetical protein